jgi:phosphoribosylanthranilate isomerase
VTLIKVSGLKDPGDAEQAVSMGAGAIACVFYAASPRYVTMPQAWEIRRVLPERVTFAGIFVDTPVPIIRQIARHLQLDMIQLFGNETRAEVDSLGPSAHKAITVRGADELDTAVRTYVGRRGRDSSNPAMLVHLADDVATGWSLIADTLPRTPILLASDELDGVTARDAIAAANPMGVDVWESVESEPGRLDPVRFGDLVAAVGSVESRAGGGDAAESDEENGG